MDQQQIRETAGYIIRTHNLDQWDAARIAVQMLQDACLPPPVNAIVRELDQLVPNP